ncbi:hypothetical protein ES703_55972 [subsurface metagenome]
MIKFSFDFNPWLELEVNLICFDLSFPLDSRF